MTFAQMQLSDALNTLEVAIQMSKTETDEYWRSINDQVIESAIAEIKLALEQGASVSAPIADMDDCRQWRRDLKEEERRAFAIL